MLLVLDQPVIRQYLIPVRRNTHPVGTEPDKGLWSLILSAQSEFRAQQRQYNALPQSEIDEVEQQKEERSREAIDQKSPHECPVHGQQCTAPLSLNPEQVVSAYCPAAPEIYATLDSWRVIVDSCLLQSTHERPDRKGHWHCYACARVS